MVEITGPKNIDLFSENRIRQYITEVVEDNDLEQLLFQNQFVDTLVYDAMNFTAAVKSDAEFTLRNFVNYVNDLRGTDFNTSDLKQMFTLPQLQHLSTELLSFSNAATQKYHKPQATLLQDAHKLLARLQVSNIAILDSIKFPCHAAPQVASSDRNGPPSASRNDFLLRYIYTLLPGTLYHLYTGTQYCCDDSLDLLAPPLLDTLLIATKPNPSNDLLLSLMLRSITHNLKFILPITLERLAGSTVTSVRNAGGKSLPLDSVGYNIAASPLDLNDPDNHALNVQISFDLTMRPQTQLSALYGDAKSLNPDLPSPTYQPTDVNPAFVPSAADADIPWFLEQLAAEQEQGQLLQEALRINQMSDAEYVLLTYMGNDKDALLQKAKAEMAQSAAHQQAAAANAVEAVNADANADAFAVAADAAHAESEEAVADAMAAEDRTFYERMARYSEQYGPYLATMPQHLNLSYRLVQVYAPQQAAWRHYLTNISSAQLRASQLEALLYGPWMQEQLLPESRRYVSTVRKIDSDDLKLIKFFVHMAIFRQEMNSLMRPKRKRRPRTTKSASQAEA